MAVIYKSRCKPDDGVIETSNQAIVFLGDGIWRLFHGYITKDYGGSYFTFIHQEHRICVSEGSYRKLYDDTSEEEGYDIVCRSNIEGIRKKGH